MPATPRFPFAHAAAIAVAVTALLGGGCSTYDGVFSFEPRPAEVLVSSPDVAPDSSARLLASIVGVRRADRSAGAPASVELRVRVENTGAKRVSFDPTSMVLLTGALDQLPAPMIVDETAASAVAPVVDLAPGESSLTTARFPLPTSPRSMDLSRLDLQWFLDLDGVAVTGNTAFERRAVRYYAGPSYTSWWWAGYPSPYYYGYLRPFGWCDLCGGPCRCR